MENITKKQAVDMFRSASLLMQNFVIGYIKVGDRYEPAISPSETLMPLSSFGISNVHIHDYFIPFPEGKNLTQMLNNPFEYYKWCQDNLK